MQHAANCDHCGPLLRRAIEDFADNPTANEESLLKGLTTNDPQWQKGFAGRLSRMTHGTGRPVKAGRFGWKFFSLSPRLLYSTGTLLLLMGIAWWFLVPRQEKRVEALLAEAYTQRRTIELRIPGASYGPVRALRGGTSSRFENPEVLLEAESLVAKNLARRPNDPVWLAAEGRVDLLEGNSEGAIKTLRQALDLKPDSQQVKIDLASAYFERAESTANALDIGTAVEWLSQALKQDPDNSVALFNRAIVYERLFLYDQARQDWERYLQVDPKGEWAAEAKFRLDGLREKIKKRNTSLAPLTENPLTAINLLTRLLSIPSTSLKSSESAMEEDYIQVATLYWLPNLNSSFSKKQALQSDQFEKKALTLLSELLKDHHADNWMSDLLTPTSSLNFKKGMQSLVTAVRANQESNSEQARVSATQAATYFHQVGNSAGELRARFELLYTLKRSQRGPECLASADSLITDLTDRSYSWLEVQTLLEQSNCRYMVGEFHAARAAADLALKKSEHVGYLTLYLRSLGFAAGLDSSKGDMASSWQIDLKGLALYWTGPFDSLRAWQFYSDMGFAAEESSKWQLALALARESVSSIQPTGRHGEEARARFRLATVAAAAGEADEAAEQFRIANNLYRALPQTESVRAFEADGEISLAELEADSKQPERAFTRLAGIRDLLPQLKSYSIPFRYYKTLGRLYYLRGDDDQAESALRAALAIASLGMRAFSQESDRDRLTWEKETGNVYRYLVELKLIHRKDPVAALRVWEAYRAAPIVQDSVFTNARDRINDISSFSEIPFEALESSHAFSSVMEIDAATPFALPNTRLVSYAWLADGLAIWVSDGIETHSEWTAINKETFGQMANRFVEDCSNPQSDVLTIRADGQQLYRWLFAPIEHYLRPGQLIVVEADENVGLIPFQALPDPSGSYLGASWVFLYSPGIGYRKITNAAPKPIWQLHGVVVGISGVRGNLAEGLPSLPDAAIEAEKVAMLFRARTLLLDSSATSEALGEALIRAEVFHFAGHALVTTEPRGLLLTGRKNGAAGDTQDSVLFGTEEIRKLHLQKCQLVVLSACSTARSEDVFFDPEDLVGAFLRAGARDVVASRWNVDSATTRRFMASFYAGIGGRNNVPSALQMAASVIRKDAKTSHPYFWAAFSGYGTS
jgi:CHAT domain-containing protein/tetratricopeptide (TPR) repeat protein